jgi:hypothetical protein
MFLTSVISPKANIALAERGIEVLTPWIAVPPEPMDSNV